MGTHDAPALIDFILNVTGQEQITYIGHSEGATQLLAGASLLPGFYNQKLKLALLLAPPASMIHNTVPLFQKMSDNTTGTFIEHMIQFFHFYDILSYRFLTSLEEQGFCRLFNGYLCNLVLRTFLDADPEVDDTDRFDVYLANLPAGAGYRTIIHYGQLMGKKIESFTRYDYLEKGNMERYGQKTPPDYDLEAIEFPVAIMSGAGDRLADRTDVQWTAAQLSSLTFKKQYDLGHMSFVIGKDMRYFTQDAMAILNHYNGLNDGKDLLASLANETE